VFPAYVIVGGERVLFLEGLNRTPVNGDTISGATIRTGKITAVQDILAADQAYRVIVI
jgi:hypothetical protein